MLDNTQETIRMVHTDCTLLCNTHMMQQIIKTSFVVSTLNVSKL